MAKLRNQLKLTETMLRSIEYVLPKLKYSVYINQIVRWLENFEETEVDNALDFLFFLEYITFSELQIRLNEQLEKIDNYFSSEKRFVLVPFAEYPKSNDIVLYLISKCPSFDRLRKQSRIQITADLSHFKITSDSVLIFVDDFIGTGNSFNKWYKTNDVDDLYNLNPCPSAEQAILAAIIMEDANLFLRHQYPEMVIFGEFRKKIFSKDFSPFNLSGNRFEMKQLCLKYGVSLRAPLGYGKSESLVAFDYGTPNNSLSIIWSDRDWSPIFPRLSRSRMKKASEIKNEAAFYYGLMNKLKITFDDDIEVGTSEKSEKLTSREDHSILVYLVLTERLYYPIQICQILGITLLELNNIISRGEEKHFSIS